jgi:hypothetical protein
VVLRDRDVQDWSQVHVDADLAELEAGRAGFQGRRLPVVVLRQGVGRERGRQRREPLDGPALLVDRDEEPGAAALRRGSLQALDLGG